jgi:hypothetical protein
MATTYKVLGQSNPRLLPQRLFIPVPPQQKRLSRPLQLLIKREHQGLTESQFALMERL